MNKKIKVKFAKGENTLHTYEFLTDNEDRDIYILSHMLRMKDAPKKIRKSDSILVAQCEDCFIYPDGDETSTAIGNFLYEHKEKVIAVEAKTLTGKSVYCYSMMEYPIYEMHHFAMQFVQNMWYREVVCDYGIIREYVSVSLLDQMNRSAKYDDAMQRKWDSAFYSGKMFRM